MTYRYEKVSTQCSVIRSPEIPREQVRDYDLDLQINRLMTAATLEEARKNSDMNAARQSLINTLAMLKSSITASDPYVGNLIQDLEEVLGDMRDQQTFQRVAVAKMAWMGDAHEQQRSVGQAGNSYITETKKKMQYQAEDEQMQRYMVEERASEEAARSMKERIESRRKQLEQGQRMQQDTQMQRYMAEEKAAEEAARSMKERIERRKREIQENKNLTEEEQMCKYISEERASEEASRAMKERLVQRKKELGIKKTDN